MFKKLFALENDKISSVVRKVIAIVGAVLTTLGVVGGDEWAMVSSTVDSLMGGAFMLYSMIVGVFSKDKPAPVATPTV